MATTSGVDEAAGRPLAPNAPRAPHPPASNPPPEPARLRAYYNQPPPAISTNPAAPLFHNYGTPTQVVAAGTTAWGPAHYPPPLAWATTGTSSGGYNPSSSSLPLDNDNSIIFPPLPPVHAPPQLAMVDPSYYCPWQTQGGFPPHWAGAAAPPPAWPPQQLQQTTPMQSAWIMQPPTSYEPQEQAQGTAAGAEAATAAPADPTPALHDAPEPPAPRRRGRPRKLATDATASKPAASKPKRARAPSARGKRAASLALQQTASVAAGSSTAIMSGQVHVQHPADQAATGAVVAVAPSATSNPAALLHQQGHHQGELQSASGSNSGPGGAGDQQAAATASSSVPYAMDTSAAGIRFSPRGEDLIFYLRKKYAGEKMPVDFFKEFNVYDAHPEAIKAACGESVDGCWYAFSSRKRKYKNGHRPARSVFGAGGEQVGFWKSNTKLKDVHPGDRDHGPVVGKVTALTFMLGRQRGTGADKPKHTSWKMREYSMLETEHQPDGSAMLLNEWVVCQLFYKEKARSTKKKCDPEQNLCVEDYPVDEPEFVGQ
ncbi:hypothetical protein BS78_01G036600 [Paspalum vaginatum]|nr:hypothetical protein BS78_01G036600 [Paspalum vaginatum]